MFWTRMHTRYFKCPATCPAQITAEELDYISPQIESLDGELAFAELWAAPRTRLLPGCGSRGERCRINLRCP